MDTYQLNRKINDALQDAQNVQREISEKEFDLEMQSINNRYSYNQQNRYIDNLNQQNAIQMIELLKDKRDIYLSSALFYALHSINKDLNGGIFNSMSDSLIALSLVNISSFIVYQVKSFKLDSSTRDLAIKISAQLMLKGLKYMSARDELSKILDASYRQ